jgi:hypothetical protein
MLFLFIPFFAFSQSKETRREISKIYAGYKSLGSEACTDCYGKQTSENDCAGFEEKIKEYSCNADATILNPFMIVNERNKRDDKIPLACQMYLLKKISQQTPELIKKYNISGAKKDLFDLGAAMHFFHRNQLLDTMLLNTCSDFSSNLEKLAMDVQSLVFSDMMRLNESVLASLKTRLNDVRRKKYAKTDAQKEEVELDMKNRLDAKTGTELEEAYCKALTPCALAGGESRYYPKLKKTYCIKGGLMLDKSCLKLKGEMKRQFDRALEGMGKDTAKCMDGLGGNGSVLKEAMNEHLSTTIEHEYGKMFRTQICCGSDGCASESVNSFSKEDRDNLRRDTGALAKGKGSPFGTVFLSASVLNGGEHNMKRTLFHEMLHRLGMADHPFHNMTAGDQYMNMVPKGGKCVNASAGDSDKYPIKWVAQEGKCIPDPSMSVENIECAKLLTSGKMEVMDPIYACEKTCFTISDTVKKSKEFKQAQKLCQSFAGVGIPTAVQDVTQIQGQANNQQVNLCSFWQAIGEQPVRNQ